jgi:PKD repeat protein
MITRFLSVVLVLLLPAGAMAQCTASFTYTANGNTVTFDGMVAPAQGPGAQYLWWFSDNNTSASVEDPVHTFSAPGTYMVYFSVYDPSTQCTDSLGQSVVVGGCTADFTAIDSMNTVSFTSTTTAGPGAQYVWSFGDNNYSNAANPTHTYLSPGTYLVCLTVYDAQQNFCDSTCHPVTVQGPPGGCVTNFTSIDSIGYVFFISSTNAGPNAMYVWDFGDGNFANTANPSHIYAAPGIYTVCLTVYDSMQNICDSTCQTIQVSTVGMTETDALQASLNAAPNPADGSLAISFMANNTGTATITLFDAAGRIATGQNVNVHSAGLTKTELNTSTTPQGVYLVKIEVNGTTAWTRIAITHQ